jgi:hypothetical protein
MVSIAGSPGTDPISGEAFPAGIMVDAINAPSQAADPIVGGAESWHAVTLDSGWTNQGGSNPNCSYRLLPQKSIIIVGYINHASFSANLVVNNSNPLPTPYRPINYQHAGAYTNNGGCGVSLSPTGVITVENPPSSSTYCRFTVVFPLDT